MSRTVQHYARTRPATARASPAKETPTAWAAPVGAGVPEVPAEPLEPAPPVVEEGEPVVTVVVPLEELTGAPVLMMTAVVVPLAGTVTIGVLVTGTTTLLVTTATDVETEPVAGTLPAPDEAGTPDVAGGAWIWPSLIWVMGWTE